jgi:hypothetical protein
MVWVPAGSTTVGGTTLAPAWLVQATLGPALTVKLQATLTVSLAVGTNALEGRLAVMFGWGTGGGRGRQGGSSVSMQGSLLQHRDVSNKLVP